MNKKVFLIDDDDFLLEMYSLKFRSSGWQVETARGAEDALAKLKEGFKPDIILLDLVMPQIDGFEFLKMLKEQKLMSGIKIVILSNLGQKEDIDKGMALGASAFLIKSSLTPSEVVKKTEEILS